jgi:hypothetical protein
MSPRKFSVSIERVRRRLEGWRQTRAYLRAPIPKSIWAEAVALARQQGLYQTARALPIHYGALKQHLEVADRTAGVGARSGFVELRPMAPPAWDDCVLEVDGPRTTVRLRVHGIGVSDLCAALLDSLDTHPPHQTGTRRRWCYSGDRRSRSTIRRRDFQSQALSALASESVVVVPLRKRNARSRRPWF